MQHFKIDTKRKTTNNRHPLKCTSVGWWCKGCDAL